MNVEKGDKNINNLELLQSLLLYQNKSISVYRSHVVKIVQISNIIYVKSFSNYSGIFLSDGTNIMTSKTLKHWEGKINDSHFLRCHNSYLLNCKYVESFDLSKNEVMINNIPIPISKTKKNNFIKFFN